MTRLRTLPTVLQGQAGVHRVISELILRGHRPYTPSSDTGVDVLLESGVRVQIKTTMRASAHFRLTEGTFLFSLAPARRVIKSEVQKQTGRIFSSTCDFVVLWAIEPDRFWVVPSGVLDGRHTVTISPVKQWRDFDRDQVEAMKAEGLSLAEIAERLNVAVRTVTRRMTTYSSPKREYTVLPQYENRWDLITATVATLREANEVVHDPRAAVSASDKPSGSPVVKE